MCLCETDGKKVAKEREEEKGRGEEGKGRGEERREKSGAHFNLSCERVMANTSKCVEVKKQKQIILYI